MNKRKNRGAPVRAPRAKTVSVDGVYNNPHFMHAATLQVGNVVRVRTSGGMLWEGVFRTFSSSFDLCLELAARVNENKDKEPLIAETTIEKLIFKRQDIAMIEANDVDLEYPTRDTFQTDTAITARMNGSYRYSPEERELEPWEPAGLNGGDSMPLELDSANGWDANDMFRKNEQDYGVTSTFDQSLKGYTVPLRTDSADYREAEAKANQIANEIESNPGHKARIDLENGDEEAAFAAVVRPSGNNNNSCSANNNNNNTQEPNDKYIPPAKRKNQNSGKLVRSTPPPQPLPSPKANAAPMPYPTHPSPHGNNPPPPPMAVVQQHGMQQQQPPPPQAVASPPFAPAPQHGQMPMPPHGRPHSHTPPHSGYSPSMQRQGPPMGQKPHMNGEMKQPNGPPPGGPRLPRNYAGPPQSNQPPPPQQQYQQQPLPPPPQAEVKQQQQELPMKAIKDLHSFAQDFKMAASGPPPVSAVAVTSPPEVSLDQMQAVAAMQQAPPPPQQQPPPNPQVAQLPPRPQPTPPQQQPQQSVSPQQEAIEKVTNNFKKSTLNPNAKEFVLNPAAKPFQPRPSSVLPLPSSSASHLHSDSCDVRTVFFSPSNFNHNYYRSPSTPSASRPHTPQTPSHNPYIPVTMGNPGGQAHMSLVNMMPVNYMMPTQHHAYPQQPQGNRIRKIPMAQMRADVTSQMQVAAATGQPLLAPGPIQPIVYPPGIQPQGYPPMHALRMYETTPSIQYLQPNPSNAPSPAQPPQYGAHGGQGQPPPPQQYQAPPPPQTHPQFSVLCPFPMSQPHMLQGMQYLQQAPPPQHHIPVVVSHQHPQLQQHGPAP